MFSLRDASPMCAQIKKKEEKQKSKKQKNKKQECDPEAQCEQGSSPILLSISSFPTYLSPEQGRFFVLSFF
jgi:hypothetical protein